MTNKENEELDQLIDEGKRLPGEDTTIDVLGYKVEIDVDHEKGWLGYSWFDKDGNKLGQENLSNTIDYDYNQMLKKIKMDIKDDAADRKKKAKMKKNEELDQLIDDQDALTEDFKEKAKVIFESTVDQKVKEISEQLVLEQESTIKEMAEELVLEQESFKQDLTDKVDSYLDYVISEWLEENRLAVESGLRTEIAENFINSMKSVFTEYYIDIPEEKEDIVQNLAEKVDSLKDQMNESEAKNIELHEQLKEYRRKELIEECAFDLSLSQKEKFNTLCEGIDFGSSSDSYAKKISILKETYFGKESASTSALKKTFLSESDSSFDTLGDNVDTSIDEDTSVIPSKMSLYAEAMKRSSGKTASGLFDSNGQSMKGNTNNGWGR